MAFVKKVQSILIVAAILAAVAGLLWGLSTLIAGYGSALQEQLQTLANEQAFAGQYEELLETMDTVATDQALLNEFVLQDDRDTIDLLSQLDAIAAQQQVILETNQLQENPKDDFFNLITLAYSIEGEAAAVMRMIRIFETLPYHGEITQLNLDRSINSETGVPTLKAAITLLLTIRKYD